MPEGLSISAVILAHNEAAQLPRCIAALKACAEVVVVDDGSCDGSPEIAAAAGARVVHHPFTSFADQRNWAMESAGLQCDWALHLDADEIATPAALEEIRRRLPSMAPGQVGFIARKVLLDGRWLRHSADYPVYVARLVHRRGPRFAMRGHGDVIQAPAEAATLFDEPIWHDQFVKGWEDWELRHRRYAEAEARRILEGGARFAVRDLVSALPARRRTALRALSLRVPGRPALRFLYAYVLRRGFLDGRPGFVFCRAMARYERMIDLQVAALRRGRAECASR